MFTVTAEAPPVMVCVVVSTCLRSTKIVELAGIADVVNNDVPARPRVNVAAVAAVAFLAWTNAMLPEFNGLVFGLSVLVAVFWLAGLFSVLKVREGWAFIFSAATIATFVATLFYALYPRVMPSSISSKFDLTITNASTAKPKITNDKKAKQRTTAYTGTTLVLAPGVAATIASVLGLPAGSLPDGLAFGTADVTLYSTTK